ncbi:MAG: glutathione S-transferase family protein [Alphaproteobacteria bacterium]|nr:glutathione S-transferase family protein [Alphaproteobacteria bacterium]
MSELILHQYPASPYSEKVRAVFGRKALAWQAVTIPVIMPKPELMPLTGGYRKTPVLQIGADIYCDTLLILDEIERRHPAPNLYPGDAEGQAKALSWWIERTCFGPAAAVIFAAVGDRVPQAFKDDRARFSGRDFDPAKMQAAAPAMRDTLRAHFAWLAGMLRNRPFMLGGEPSAADFAAYHVIWFLLRNLGDGIAAELGLAAVMPWYERMKAFGHGKRGELDAREALEIARRADPAPLQEQALGKAVVMADDTGRDPVEGELVALDDARIVLRRSDPQVGLVHLHFPRAGFILRRA